MRRPSLSDTHAGSDACAGTLAISIAVAYGDPDGVADREAHVAAAGARGNRDAVTFADTDAHTHPQSAQPRVGRGRALRVERDDRFVGVVVAQVLVR